MTPSLRRISVVACLLWASALWAEEGTPPEPAEQSAIDIYYQSSHGARTLLLSVDPDTNLLNAEFVELAPSSAALAVMPSVEAWPWTTPGLTQILDLRPARAHLDTLIADGLKLGPELLDRAQIPPTDEAGPVPHTLPIVPEPSVALIAAASFSLLWGGSCLCQMVRPQRTSGGDACRRN